MKLNGFIMPNALWDADLDIYERAIITHIVRKTIGWGKVEDGISLSQFVKDLKISKPKVISTIKSLISKGLIVKKEQKNQHGGQSFNIYFISEKVINETNEVVNDINRGSKSHLQGVVNDINRGSKSHLQGVVNDINRGSKSHLQGVVNDINTQITSNTNNTQQITSNTNIKKINKKSSKSFSFSLSKSTQYENLSSEYKQKLKARLLLEFGAEVLEKLEDFELSCISNGYKYKNFYAAFKKWFKDVLVSKNIDEYPSHPNLSPDFVVVGAYNNIVYAINKKTLETKTGRVKVVESDFKRDFEDSQAVIADNREFMSAISNSIRKF